MARSSLVSAYLSAHLRAELIVLAKRNKLSLSEQIGRLIEAEAAREQGEQPTPQTLFHALQHIAIGVDALLKFHPDQRAVEVARAARNDRLGSGRDAH